MATVHLGQKRRVLVRAIPDTYSAALAKYFGTGPTDLPLARKQHAAYCQTFEDAGLEVIILDADNNHPDCLFVEDQAIIIDGHVLFPIPGHPSRVAEQPPIAEFLTQQYGSDKVQHMNSNCKMDGGDILRLGDLFFVGRSSRTNDAGIGVLRELVEGLGHELRVINLPQQALHLTSVSSTPTDTIIFTAEGYLSEQDFGQLPDGCEIRWMPKEEVYGCNTIGLDNGQVLVAKGYPTVLSALEELGLKPIVMDMSQIKAADGSLTCLSIFY